MSIIPTLTPPTSSLDSWSHLTRVHHSIQFTIACLYRLPLRHPAPLDRLRQQDSADASPYHHFDVLYVKDKFPSLNPDLASRLGTMITRRRQLLFFQESHSQRLKDLGQPVRTTIPSSGPDPKLSSKAPRYEAETRIAPSQVTDSHHTMETKATTLKIREPTTEELLYAPSAIESQSSIASTYTGKELKIEIPLRPIGDDEKELDYFECPYCKVAKSISTKHQWK